MTGKVKWFNAEKVMVLLNVKTAAMYSYISLLFRLKVTKLWKTARLLSSMWLKAAAANRQLTFVL